MTNALPTRWMAPSCPGSIGQRILRAAAPALLAFGLAGTASAQNIVINEIHYHPASQDVREEFVELHNAGPTNVNLAGWTLRGGIAFTFPNVSINAGGYLVVAAHLETFTEQYPAVLNLTGGWLTFAVTNVNGRLFTNATPVLSNTRNSVRLHHATGAEIDSVTYADAGDWAVRRRGLLDGGSRGWTWYAEHDGLGKTLELRNPALPNEHGQNWGASTTAGGTPGSANSIRSTDIPPLILEVRHLPAIPTSLDSISVSARILDEEAGVPSINLRWRVDGAGTFNTVAMLDNGASGDGAAGDGIFGALLAPMANNTIIEYYIEATDAEGYTRTWPAAALQAVDQGNGSLGQVANALFQVDNAPQQTNAAPLYKLIMTAAEQTELGEIFNSQNGRSANSDAEMNCTFLSLDGGGTEVRYLCGTRNRGHGSRFSATHNYRINFSSETPWKGVTGFNMNAVNVPAQVVGATLALKAGAAGNLARFARLRVNNGAGPGGTPANGLYAANEDVGSDWTSRQFPNNDGGNIYSVVRDIAPKEFNYRGETPASYQNTYFKQSNVSENDWRDLIGMLQVMGDNQTGSFTMAAARQVANVDQWLVHLAVMNLFGNAESGINTGNNDDYYWYRGVNDPRFVMVYHDLDSILGISSKSAGDPDIFSATTCCASGDTVGIAAAMNFFMRHPQIQPLYYRTLQDLLDGPFSAAQFNSTVDQILSDFPQLAGTASSMKTWMATRRSTVQGVINGLVPAATNNPIATVSGEPRSPTWRTAAALTVAGTNITHYQWRLNNGPWSAELPVATAISLAGLPNNSTNTVQVVGRNSGGIYQDKATPTVSKTWIVNTSLPTVRLNEVLARNVAAVSHDGKFPDLIELHNEGPTIVALTGLRLSDDPANPGKFTFPSATLAPGAYLTVYADNSGPTGFYTGFGLDQAGDSVLLYNSVANGGALLDAVSFGPQLADLSIGRFGPAGDWALAQPSPGATNVLQPLGNARAVKLNEWLAASSPPTTQDYIELYNPNTLPVALGGLFFTDEPLGWPARHRVADLSFIAANGYTVFIADGETALGPTHLNFGLAAEQGQIGLFAADLTVVDCVVYGPQRTDISYGRCPNGSGTVGAQSFSTAGLPNSCVTPPPPPQTVTLIPVNQTWTYNTNGVTPAPNWTANNYDDSGWNGSGPAMLGRVANTVPEPVSTPLAQNNNRVTYYYRTHFNVPAGVNYTSLQISNLIDDGAVFYLNGSEVGRIRMPDFPSVVDSNTIATSITATTWMLPTPASISVTNLRTGDNVMAVEVHQNSGSSADNIMAIRLEALIVTNAAANAGIVISEVLANNATTLVVDGRTPDLIELHNPSSNAVDLAGMSLNDSPLNSPPKWIFPPGSIIPARGYLTVYADASAPASATNTGFGLGSQGGALYLFKKAPDTNELFDRVTYGLQTADFSIGRVPVTSTNWVLTYPSFGATNVAATLGPQAGLRVNEWMADPASGDDWFEIYNAGSEPVLLSGLRLTDSFGTPNSYVIPALSYIGLGSNAFQVFIADNPLTPAGPEHVNFKLGKDGDSIFLLASNNATVLDFASFGLQLTGVSQGRLPDGSGYEVSFPETSTPGDANYLPLPGVVINEVLTHTDLPLEDAIELRNLTGASVDLSGWYLSDDKDALRKFRIPNGTVLPANGFTVFYEIAFNNDTNGVPFALSSAEGDQVFLAEADGNGVPTGRRALAKVGPSANGVSFGRYINSVGTVDYPAMSALSLGTALTAQSPPTQGNLDLFRTGTGAANPYPKVGPVVVTEIMYHPPDVIVPGVSTNDNEIEEFIELKNTSGSLVALYDPAHPTNGWRLRDAVSFTFSSSHSLGAGASLLVVSFDPVTNLAARAQFQARYGSNATLIGPWSGKLDNSTDSVELVRPDPPQPDGSVPQVLVEKVLYQDLAPWPAGADGSGLSLQRVSESGYANDPTNWVAAVPTPAPSANPDTDGDGMPDDWEMTYGLNKNFPGDAGLDTDGDGLTNLQEYQAGTSPNNGLSTLRLAASQAGNVVNLQFTAVAGRTYTVLWTPSLPSGGNWFRLWDISPQGSTGPVTVPDNLAGGTQRFYRVVTPALP